MNNIITRRSEMFVRVRDFCDERANSFPANTPGGKQFNEIKNACETLAEMAATQASGVGSAQQATAERMGARETLRETMQAMTRTARAMGLDTPGLENKFRLPRSGSDQALLQSARAFVNDALPLKDEFIGHGLAGTFIEDLQGQIADLVRAIGGQNAGRDAHVTATASIDAIVERAMVAVMKLDAIVRNKFRDDPATLAAWESARHVERAPRSSRRARGDAGDKKKNAGDKA